MRKRPFIYTAAAIFSVIAAVQLRDIGNSEGNEPRTTASSKGLSQVGREIETAQARPSTISPTVDAQALEGDADLVAVMRQHAAAALHGDVNSQLSIARAMMTCLKVSGIPVDLLTNSTMATRTPVPSVVTERLLSEQQRCRRFRKDDPFEGLPPRAGGYPAEYWLAKAADSRHPLALAIWASDEVLDAVASAPGPERNARLHEIQQGLERAAQSNDPEAYYYIGRSLMLADNQGGALQSIRAAGWLLLACRRGACDRLADPLAFSYCPPGLGRDCNQAQATEYEIEQNLGSANYAQAVQLSYGLEDSLRMQRWDELDLRIR